MNEWVKMGESKCPSSVTFAHFMFVFPHESEYEKKVNNLVVTFRPSLQILEIFPPLSLRDYAHDTQLLRIAVFQNESVTFRKTIGF